MNWDAIIRANRLGRAIGLIVLLGGFLLWWRFIGDPGPPVAVRDVPGVIAEVYENAYLVHLDDGLKVRVFRTVNVEKGGRVVLTGSKYASGEESFVLTDNGVLH